MKSNIFWVTIFLVATFICLLFSIFNAFVYNKTIKGAYLTNLGRNWNNGPVLSLHLTEKHCEKPESNVINDIWAGTEKGCLRSGTVEKGSCPRKSNGVTIPPQPSINYTKWKNSTLCGQRKSGTYFDLQIAEKEYRCPSGSKSCGIVDSMNNVLCMPRSAHCPLNSIKIARNNAIDNATSLTFDDGSQISSVNSSTAKGNILVDFKISDDTPCIDPKNQPFSTPYILDKFFGMEQCQESFPGIVYDERYIYLDSTGKKDFLQQNGILKALSELPFIPGADQIEGETKLYYRNYIGLSQVCQQMIQERENGQALIAQLIDQEETAKAVSTLLLSCFALTVISMMSLLVFYPIMVCVWNQLDHPAESFFVTNISSLLNICAFAIQCVVLSRIAGKWTEYSLLDQPDCTERVTYIAIRDSISAFRKIQVLTFISAFLNLATFSYTLFSAIACCLLK